MQETFNLLYSCGSTALPDLIVSLTQGDNLPTTYSFLLSNTIKREDLQTEIKEGGFLKRELWKGGTCKTAITVTMKMIYKS